MFYVVRGKEKQEIKIMAVKNGPNYKIFAANLD